MLDAKKMGHSIYSFLRKQELFEKIHQICDTNEINNQYINKKLKRMIMTQNLSNFSKYLETIKQNEFEFISSNKEIFINLLSETKWKKGLNVFKTYVSG